MRKPQFDQLNSKLMGKSLALYEKFLTANEDLVQRGEIGGVRLAYDKDTDVLTITIGEGSSDFYTQGVHGRYFDLDLETDKIVGITIVEFASRFLKSRSSSKVFKDVLPVLVSYGSIAFLPDGSAHKAAEELRMLAYA